MTARPRPSALSSAVSVTAAPAQAVPPAAFDAA